MAEVSRRVRRLLALTACVAAACGSRASLFLSEPPVDSGSTSGTNSGANSGAKGNQDSLGSGANAAPEPTSKPDAHSGAKAPATRFVAIGDYGLTGTILKQVAELVKSLEPEFIITTGDNNYPSGAAETIDANIGKYFSDFIFPYSGVYGRGADKNRFFPSLGNHDWYTPGAEPYLRYFTLPGNERYYDVVWGHVHLFALDSDSNEPDGVTADSVQAYWLKERLAASKVAFQVVYMHHPPYSSGSHGSSGHMRWPFAKWGADLVLAGHDHDYERLQIDGLTYIVNGLGGASMYAFGAPIEGSAHRFNAAHGVVQIEASPDALAAKFFTTDRLLIDEVVLRAQLPTPH